MYWGLSSQNLNTIDVAIWIYSGIFLLIATIIGLNHCMDIQSYKKTSRKSCIYRPLLYQSTFCIAILFAIATLCFIIPLIIGKNNIVCSEDINNIETMAVINPGASISCTISGLCFSVSALMAGMYTAIFSMTLWKQFYAPLNSIWTELKHKSYCKCLNLITIPCQCNHSECKNKCEQCCSDLIRCRNNEPLTCWYAFCGKRAFIHYCCWSIGLTYTIFAWIGQEITSFDPLGICIIGSARGKGGIVAYNVIPHSITMGIASLFLPAAIILLIRFATRNDSGVDTKHKKLGWRLLVFFLCVLNGLTLMLVTITATVNLFYISCNFLVVFTLML